LNKPTKIKNLSNFSGPTKLIADINRSILMNSTEEQFVGEL